MKKNEPDLLTVGEVATALGVDQSTVRHWIIEDRLEVVTLPNRGVRKSHRIRRSTFDALLVHRSKQLD